MRSGRLLWMSAAALLLFVYDAIVRPLASGLVALPGLPGGVLALTAIVAVFSLAHACYALGARRTLAFFGLSAAISYVFEQVGVVTGGVYGPYHYTAYLGTKLGDVPLIIPLAWFMMIYPSYVIANLIATRRPLGTPAGVDRLVELTALSAAVMTAWDLVIDPVLSSPQIRAWVWESGGPYFGVPVQNYAGWLATTFAVYLAYRALEQGSPPEEALSGTAAALPIAAYLAMLVGNLLSGVAPAQLALIGPVAMGIPAAVAAVRLAARARAVAPRPLPATRL